jgi:uncharacterized membrane protein YhdT
VKRIAQGIAAGALAVWLISTFLPYLNPGNGGGPSFWEAATTEDVLLTLIAVAAIVVLVLGTIMELRWSAAVGIGASAFIAGQLTPTEAQTLQGFDIGFWLMEIAAFAALAASLAAAVWPDAARADTSATTVMPAVAAPAPPPAPPAPAAPAAPALPATPAWYPDPHGSGGLRLWSGSHWTDETRES